MTTVTVNEEIIALTEEIVETITVTVAEQGPPGVDADHSGLLNLESDDHLQYHTDARGDARYSPLAHDHSGVYEPADADIQSHLISTSNPHSVTAAQVGADATGTAAGLIATHEAALDPHPGYALESSLGGAALLSVGTTAGTVASGDDARFSTGTTGDAFASSHPGGNQHIDWTADQGATNLHAGNIPDLSGTYAVTAKGVTNGDSHDHSGGDGAQIAYSGLSGLPTLGTAAATAATDYATAAQGATADTAVQPGDDAADLGSGSATDNYVLTADGSGGAAWEAAAVTYAGAASEIHAATEKTTPVDADELGLVDSAASWVLKRLTWANVKATLAGVFPLLAGKSGGQTLIGGTGVTDKLVLQGTSGNGTSTATALEVKVGDNGLTSAVTITNDGKIFTSGALESGGNINIKRSAPALLLENTSGVKLGLSNSNDSFVVGQYAISDTLFFNVVTRKMGINTSSPSATIHAVKTTEQLRLGYDATNYVSATVSSTGNLTLDTSGGTIYTPDVIENTVNGEGIILKSPDGTRYKITVANGGTLSIAAA